MTSQNTRGDTIVTNVVKEHVLWDKHFNKNPNIHKMILHNLPKKGQTYIVR